MFANQADFVASQPNASGELGGVARPLAETAGESLETPVGVYSAVASG